MDKKLKAKWVKALRSGKYVQASPAKSWFEDGRHCCLGVLGEVACPDILRSEGLLSPEFDRLGVPQAMRSELIRMNDGKGDHRAHTFAEIADYIEVNL